MPLIASQRIFLFLSTFLLLGIAASNAKTSVLWRTAGESWDPREILPDYSSAGYHRGEVPMPTTSTVGATNIQADGAAPNDSIDNAAAIQDAMDATPADVAYSDSVTSGANNDVFDPDGDTRTFDKVSEASCLSVDTAGNITGTPTMDNGGPYYIVVRASDDSGSNLTTDVTSRINVINLEAEYYVSPSGSDANPGTLVAPWKTIEKARDTIRSLTLPEGGVIVWIRGGTHYVDQTIVFDERDSGTSGKPITYKAYPFEEPIFCGGKEITGWTLDSGNVYKAPINDNNWRFDQLFENGVRQTKARYPNTGYLRTDTPTSSPKLKFKFKPGDLPTWSSYVGAQVSIWNYANWFQNVIPISSINFNARVVNLSNQAPQMNLEDDRYFIQGVKEELDVAGEFYLDEPNGYLYYWPANLPIASQTIVAPIVTNVFEFKGASPSNQVKYVSLEGLTIWGSKFTDAFRDGGYSSAGPEYSSNRPGEDNREGLVQIENASHLTVKNCKLYNAGYCGVNLGYYANHNTVYGNQISNCGWHGILMAGKDNGEGVVNNPAEQIYDNKFNSIDNNHIYKCGQIIGDAAGIFLYQSGDNDIAHNLVHDMPRYGICIKGHGGLYGKYTKFGNVTITDQNYWDFYTGNNNTISYNHVYDLLNDSYDAGGISLRRPGRHNTVSNNRIHDIHTPSSMDHHFSFGIYLDGGTEYTTLTKNIIYNVKPGKESFSAPINMKKVHNTVTNNILVAETGTTGGVLSIIEGGGGQPESEGFGYHTVTKNIIFAKGSSSTLYRFNEDEFNRNMVTVSNHNLFYVEGGGTYMFQGIIGDDTHEQWKTLYSGKYDKNSVTANPLFVDQTHHNFNLKANSPAWALGFQQIDQANIGLRNSYPVAHSPWPYDRQSQGTFADVLSWTGGPQATSFDVYLGIGYASVANAGVNSNKFMGNQTKTTYAPQSLDKNKWYYWRIDESKDGNLISKGDVWKFRTIEAVVDSSGMDLIATKAGSTLDVNTQTAVITYDEDGGGSIAPVTFQASIGVNTATWTFGDLTIGKNTALTFSGNNARAIKFVATGLGPVGNGNIIIKKNFNFNGANGAGNDTTGGARKFGSGAGGNDDGDAANRAGESAASDAYTTIGSIGGGRYTNNSTEKKGGGGGAFGGDGGDSYTGLPTGGSWYGRLDLSDLGKGGSPRGGSGGGASNRGSGGSGGGALQLLAVNDITIASGASITAKGGRGSSGSTKTIEKRRSGGGGSGGGIRIVADSDRDGFGALTFVGSTLNVSGGVSDNTNVTAEYGGDGGGGRIAVSGASVFTGPMKVSGGNHGRAGSKGGNGSILLDAKDGMLSLSGNGLAANQYTQYANFNVSANSKLELSGANAIGTTTINNSAVANLSGTLVMDLNGANAGSADRLIVANGLTIAGATLDLDAINPPDDIVYVLIEYGSLTGTFATIRNMPAGYVLDYTFDGNRIALVSEVAMNYVLTVNAGIGGHVSGNGTYFQDTIANITASIDVGYHFDQWSGAGIADSNSTSTTVSMTEDRNVTANFAIDRHVLTMNSETGGSAIGAGIFDYDTNAEVNATANNGYHFDYWTGTGVNDTVSSNTTISMTTDRNISAIFARNQYLLTVNAVSGGSTIGSGTYDYETNASITATPHTGHHFLNWSGAGLADSTSAFTTASMTNDVNVTANFAIDQHILTLNAGTGGSVFGNGTFDYEANASITATPNVGYHFEYWTGSGVADSTSASTNVSMTIDRNVTASFSIDQHVLTLDVNSSGSVTGSGTYDYGAMVNISASPAIGYHFVNWTEATVDNPNTASTAILLTADANVTANFAANRHKLVLNTNPGGSVSGDGNYSYGSIVSISATPDSGFYFTDWSGDEVIDANSTITTVSMTQDRNVTANFALIPLNEYVLQIFTNPSGSGSTDGSGTYAENSNVTMAATAESGYQFLGWSVSGGTLTSPLSATAATVMINQNIDATAHFATIDHRLDLNTSTGGSTHGEGNYAHGQSVAIAATVENGHSFGGWEVTGTLNFAVTVAPRQYDGSSNVFHLDGKENPPLTLVRGVVYQFILDGSTTMGHPFYFSTDSSGGGNSYLGEFTSGVTNSRAESSSVSITVDENTPSILYYYCGNHSGMGNLVTVINSTGLVVDKNASSTSADVIASYALHAQFSLNQHLLTANAGTGGSVSADGIYDFGSDATIIATPQTGYVFSNWSGLDIANDKSSTLILSMTQDRNVTANFEVASHALIVISHPSSSGSVSGGKTYLHGTDANVTATPVIGHHFVNWSGAGLADATSAFTSVNMDQNRTVTANFSLDQHVLTLASNPPGSGTLDGDGNYAYGVTADLNATPALGYVFSNWSGSDIADVNSSKTSVLMISDQSITANFEALSYVLAVTVGAKGGGKVEGGNTYHHGIDANVTAIPDVGYHFVNWSGEGIADSTSAITTIMMDQNRTVTANFIFEQHVLTLIAEVGGSVSGDGVYHYETNASITATPAAGYHFVKWSGDAMADSASSSTSVSMDQNRTVTANFAINHHKLTLQSDPTDAGILTGDDTYDYGATADINAVSVHGYVFSRWSGDLTDHHSSSLPLSITQDITLTAHFLTHPDSGKLHYELNATAHDGNFWESDWFRFFHQVDDHWIYHFDLGWIYVHEVKESAFWHWHGILGWLWTNSYVYPAFWSNHSNHWIWFYQDADSLNLKGNVDGHLWYYDYSILQWTLAQVTEEIPSYEVTVNMTPIIGGTVSGTGSYKEGSIATFIATPAEGFLFAGWNGDLQSSSATLTAAVTRNLTLIATFEQISTEQIIQKLFK